MPNLGDSLRIKTHSTTSVKSHLKSSRTNKCHNYVQRVALSKAGNTWVAQDELERAHTEIVFVAPVVRQFQPTVG